MAETHRRGPCSEPVAQGVGTAPWLEGSCERHTPQAPNGCPPVTAPTRARHLPLPPPPAPLPAGRAPGPCPRLHHRERPDRASPTARVPRPQALPRRSSGTPACTWNSRCFALPPSPDHNRRSQRCTQPLLTRCPPALQPPADLSAHSILEGKGGGPDHSGRARG